MNKNASKIYDYSKNNRDMIKKNKEGTKNSKNIFVPSFMKEEFFEV